ncbi:transmembrane protein 98-like [Mya arenaria]|uniref:transmembrane protein 98-like n=1 Tax=Mya arenaria TaxID=6604 RepID=UPI0022E7A328|nr:transmembrane protein 98-like [Mya arenaria]XP_052802042.1 transmembrane protein 98-like [Mya arenaria]
MAPMETVVAVAIGILATVFLLSLVGLILVCRHKFCRPKDLLTQQMADTRPDVQLIEDEPKQTDGSLELDEVEISNPKLEQVLRDERWVDDVTGLVPHCIAILKTCHHLTERLVGMTMGNADKIRTQEMLTDIVTVAKRINPRVDEVVQSMYPPLDPRLLEARCTALVLSVSHLVLVTKHACKPVRNIDWIDQALADVEDHLRVLQEASFNMAPDCRTPSSSVTSGDSQQPIMNGHVVHENQSSLV